MILVVVNGSTGEELLNETLWEGEIPRVGDVMELHCGTESKWKVIEVDWVFADSPANKHEDVPLKSLCVKVSSLGSAPLEADPFCTCGHRESLHSPNGCTGRSHTCDCPRFTAKV